MVKNRAKIFFKHRMVMVESAFWSWSISGSNALWMKLIGHVFMKIFEVDCGQLFYGFGQFRRVQNFYMFYNRKNLSINFRVAKHLYICFKYSFQHHESMRLSQEITLNMHHLYRWSIDRSLRLKKSTCEFFTNDVLKPGALFSSESRKALTNQI